MRAVDLLSIRGSLRVAHIPAECMGPDPCAPLHPDVVDRLAREGKCHVSCAHSNLVVDVGLEVIRAMIGSGLGFPTTGAFGVQSQADLDVSSMKVGNAAAPPVPAAGDTDVSVTTYTIQSTSAFYPSAAAITIVGVVPQAESSLDGVGLTEEGIFIANGAMLARVTFQPEVKLPTHALQFEHTITIGRP